jgi:hypothetical protein
MINGSPWSGSNGRSSYRLPGVLGWRCVHYYPLHHQNLTTDTISLAYVYIAAFNQVIAAFEVKQSIRRAIYHGPGSGSNRGSTSQRGLTGVV